MTIQTKYLEVPLEHLELSKANARRTPATLADTVELRASIKAHGLLTPLLVRHHSAGEDGRYLVVDGARRLYALTDLAAADEHYQPGGRVPCTLEEGEHHAGELSLAGNLHVALHPADQVEAFQRMEAAGETIEAVADRFGVTARTVRRRLALAGLAPEVRAAWREGKIAAEHAQAFASNADHHAQCSALKVELMQSYREPSAPSIRSALSPRDTAPTLDADRLGRYVTLAAYEKAGGAVWRDLFADEETAPEGIRLEDRALVRELAQKKLDRKAKALTKKGWGWVETNLDKEGLWQVGSGLGRLGYASGGEYPAEQMALAGCIVIVTFGGVQVYEGAVRKADLPAVKALGAEEGEGGGAREPFDSGAGAGGTPADIDDHGYGTNFAHDVQGWRTDIIQSHLAARPAVALDLLTFQLALDVLLPEVSGEHHYGYPLGITTRLTRDAESAPEWTGAAKARVDQLAALTLEWMGEPEEDRFNAFLTLSRARKDRILAAAIAPTLHGQLVGADSAIEGYEESVAALDIPWATYRPSVEEYFGRLPKARLLSMLADVCGTVTDPRHVHARMLKKGELAEYVAATLAEDFPEWVVPGFRCDDEGDD